MSVDSRLTIRWAVAVAIGVVLLATGAGAAYLWMRASPQAAHDMAAMNDVKVPDAPRADAGPLPDVTITLTTNAVERAGIEVTPVRASGAASAARLPGLVQPNAYRQVAVTPLVGGRVTRVLVELGERVRRGQALAQVYSPALADAQTRYLSMRAELEAAHQALRRTEQLVEIGAASRQELEQVRAKHTTHATDVEGARAQLVLLGMSPTTIGRLSSASDISATTSVPAPIDGIVTARDANLGLNVDTSSKLFTVVDLSTVWIVADVYEKDFSRVRVGSRATVTTTAYPDLVLQGRVSYIDPQVNPDTRTAQARIEVRNPRGELRLGMYADIQVSDGAAASAAIVPRSAIQTVGDRQVVYVVNPKEAGKFVEREVRLGTSRGEEVEVVAGVKPGEVVVAEGSFFIRAERERLGLRPPAAPQVEDVQTARVTVGDQSFEPERLSLKAGVPARVTFVRTSDKTCATEVVFPLLKIKRALPLNQPVDIELTPQKGELAFACGMNMLRGTVVVQ